MGVLARSWRTVSLGEDIARELRPHFSKLAALVDDLSEAERLRLVRYLRVSDVHQLEVADEARPVFLQIRMGDPAISAQIDAALANDTKGLGP